MRKSIAVSLALLIGTASALADDWSGQSLQPVVVPTSNPGIASLATVFTGINPNNSNLYGGYSPYNVLCFSPGSASSIPATSSLTCPDPAYPGGPQLIATPQNRITSVPAGATAPGSLVSITASGVYADPTAPAGISRFSGAIPLSSFAMSATTEALQKKIDAVNAAQQDLQAADKRNNQGTAMALAMAGTGGLQSDETGAASFNWGTFNGQNALAAGITLRADDHVSVNGGVAGSMDGRNFGGRAGVRIGW